MRLPKPKSIPGLFLWALTAGALAVVGYLVTSLLAQNVENLSSERGYDKLLSKSWPFILAWVRDNMLVLATSASFLVGGAVCSWIYAALQARFGSAPEPEKWWVKKASPVVAHREAEIEAAPVYTPVSHPEPSPKFDFAYPKALLSAEFPPPTGSADSDGMIEMSAVLTVRNLFNGTLESCSVHVVSITANDWVDKVDKPIRWGQPKGGNAPGHFSMASNQALRRRFIFRDLKDHISRPPFVLHLVGGDYVLNDDTRYILAIELRSEYDHPTKVGVQIDVLTGKDIKVTKLAETL